MAQFNCYTNTKIEFESFESDENAVLLDTVLVEAVKPATLYAIFSELDNLAQDKIKFGRAPYAEEEDQVVFSGFEGAQIGSYMADEKVDGWTVTNEWFNIRKSNST